MQQDRPHWPDGRRIETRRLFPGLPVVKGKPDWEWRVEDWDLGDPSGGWFHTEAEALDDVRLAIEELSVMVAKDPPRGG